MADYCTIADIKTVLADTTWTTAYDAVLGMMVSAASRLIDRETKRGPNAYVAGADSTQYFDGSGGERQWIGELAAAPTKVSVAETGSILSYTDWAATDFICWPYNAQADGQPIQRLDIDLLYGTKAVWYKFPKSVKVVGKFGYSSTVPDDIKQAAITTSIRWFKRAQQAYADVGAIVELGQLRYVKALDPDVAETVRMFKRVVI